MPDRQNNVAFTKSAAPGKGMVEIRIHQGAVDIEDRCELSGCHRHTRAVMVRHSSAVAMKMSPRHRRTPRPTRRSRPGVTSERLVGGGEAIFLHFRALASSPFHEVFQIGPAEPLAEARQTVQALPER